jgi:hypothetical protein
MITSRSRFYKDTNELESLKLVVEQFKSLAGEKMIFISHKHNESNLVFRFADLLKKYGFTGYVDWEDDQMPKTTSSETAKKLKERIFSSYKFILIATNAAIESKWCNWEIGFGDAHKYIDHIALFPIKEDGIDYNGNEYLSIYPTIQSKNWYNYFTADYYVQYPDGVEIELSKWLKL